MAARHAQQGMRISILALTGWVLAFSLPAGMLGAYPTYRIAGRGGLAAMLAAGLVVLVSVLGSGLLVAARASRGPTPAATAFLVGVPVRWLLCLALGLNAWAMELSPLPAFLLWLGMFYVVMLLGEGIWLSRALLNDAFLEALGEIDRSAATKAKPARG